MSTTNEAMSTAKDQAGAVAGTAKDQASAVAGSAGEAARDVAGTAKDQAGAVAAEVTVQARDLLGETREEVRHQAQAQTRRLAQTVRSLAAEVNGMASGANAQPGPATDLARQLADRADGVAGYLENSTPDRLVEDLRQFARRRTGLFLFSAAAAGFLAARLAKAASGEKDQAGSPERSPDPALLSTVPPSLTAPTGRPYYGEPAATSPSPATSAMATDSPGSTPTAGDDPESAMSMAGYGAPTIEAVPAEQDPALPPSTVDPAAGTIPPVNPPPDDGWGGR